LCQADAETSHAGWLSARKSSSDPEQACRQCTWPFYVKDSAAQAAASEAVGHSAHLAKLGCSGARDVQPGWNEAVVLNYVILLKFRLQLL
jgi:hypothetical protein